MRDTIDVIISQGFAGEKSGKCLVECNEILCVLAALGLVLSDGHFRHVSDIRKQRLTVDNRDISAQPRITKASFQAAIGIKSGAWNDRSCHAYQDCVRRSCSRSCPDLEQRSACQSNIQTTRNILPALGECV